MLAVGANGRVDIVETSKGSLPDWVTDSRKDTTLKAESK